MAFPTTSVLDDFNRANEGPPPSASWTNSAGTAGLAGLQVVSSTLQNSGSFEQREDYWNVTTFGPDSEVYVTVTTVGITSFRLYLRLQTPGTAGTDGYLAYFASTAVFIYRIDNTSLTQQGASVSLTLAGGESYGFEIIGSDMNVYKKSGGSWGTTLATRTEATYSAAGNIAIGTDAQNWVLDDFGGGTVVTAAPPPVGIPTNAYQ
jgi:hypothetical protein